jgi:hypothetical protein
MNNDGNTDSKFYFDPLTFSAETDIALTGIIEMHGKFGADDQIDMYMAGNHEENLTRNMLYVGSLFMEQGTTKYPFDLHSVRNFFWGRLPGRIIIRAHLEGFPQGSYVKPFTLDVLPYAIPPWRSVP